ncbi:MAG: ATP-binding protein [Muribaculaceae bacterium]|nr:ATP-binding protein [Muribaculaceae bacterium]MDE6754830.1 ATP-binding protein [Muribaculaceae bacterium]
MEIIIRQNYLSHIITHLNRGMMIILVGQRRVGKSFMLRQLHHWLEENRPEGHVIYINKELLSFSHLTNATLLYEYVVKSLIDNKENYLLIDEVQDIEGYENALRSLHAEDRCQIIATGSNAYIFSSELSTRLAGRYIEIPIYGLSYREFLEFHKLDDSDESLKDYLRVGGLPGLRMYDIKDEIHVRDYLQGVYTTIMMRDVITRENIRNASFIENLSRFMADNDGKLISINSIVKFMKSQGEKISEAMLSSYISYLCKALIINPVARYDIHGKRLFEMIFKYYFADHGLRNYLCGFDLRNSIEKVMENVVYLHLLQQGYKVNVGILRAGEVDFVATKDSDTIYVQVTYLPVSEETIKREFGNLAAIKDNYPKYVVSMDPLSGGLSEYPGIRHLHLRDFLKSIR